MLRQPKWSNALEITKRFACSLGGKSVGQSKGHVQNFYYVQDVTRWSFLNSLSVFFFAATKKSGSNQTTSMRSLSRNRMVQFVLRNSGPKFYPKNGSFWLFLVNQKLRRKYPVDHRHKIIKVSLLRSSTNFKKGIISKILYKLIYFCLIDKKGHFYYIKYQLFT